MTPEILQSLRRLQTYAAGLSELAASVRAEAPESFEGADPTGSVSVKLGADGVPTAIRVEPDWDSELEPEALGAAVMSAVSSAVTVGMQAWSATLEQTSWRERVARYESEAAAQPAALVDAGPLVDSGSLVDSAPLVDSVASPLTDRVSARDLGELTEELIAALTAARTRAAAAEGVGAAGSGRVSIVLARTGLQACTIEPTWAWRQTADALTRALMDALRAARADLDAKVQPPPAAADLGRLADEAMATLRALSQSALSQSALSQSTLSQSTRSMSDAIPEPRSMHSHEEDT